jgi:Erythromycin biosynthesis protein CIII-like, C-terminal domain/Erythromycin biosynthesis protein CIII-like, N-terminal domain
LDAARQAGHETLVVGPDALAGMVAESGHPFSGGGAPPEAEVAPIREQIPAVAAREASVLGNRELFGRLATAALLPHMESVIEGWTPDVVVRDPCEYASAVIAHARGVATAQVAIGLAEVEWGSIDVAAPALEAHRAGLTDELRRSPYLSRFPPSIDPSPFPATRRFREPREVVTRPLPDWWDGSAAPLVYVSLGTVLGHMSAAADAFRTVLDAVAEIDARVLLTVGRHFDSGQLEPIPGHVHVEPWVDQAEVLARAEIVVCHGGSGTSFGALAAGLPLVVVPLFADQFANGTRIAEAGAGIVVDTGTDRGGRTRPHDRRDARRIAEAIDTVSARASYRERARCIAAEMASAPSAVALVEEVIARR